MSRTLLFLTIISLLIAACGTQTPTELPPENYPPPVEDSIQPDEVEEPAYPYPIDIVTPEISLDSAYPYPAPESGMEAFVIIPAESQVSYEVGEVFLNQGNAFNLAVGVTSEVNGEILVDRANPQNSSIGPISVDVSQFTSDNQRRDNAIRERFLESAKFPIVEFNPQEIQSLPESYTEGEQISFQVSGDLTVRDVTKPVTFEVTLVGDGVTMTGEATTTILMSDFGFGPISIGGILNTEDEVKVTFAFVARK
jgi:polyisoprenoid-binding protein YceI